jgi:hypothetical protein
MPNRPQMIFARTDVMVCPVLRLMTACMIFATNCVVIMRPVVTFR